MLKWIPIAVVCTFGFAGCATISQPQMTLMGDGTQKNEVVGKSTHWDFVGLGVNTKQYTEEYNSAIDDAFQNAPSGTLVLKNLKVFRSPNNLPIVAGVGSMLVGEALTSGSGTYNSQGFVTQGPSAGLGIFLMMTGLGLSAINSYDLVIIGEPSSN